MEYRITKIRKKKLILSKIINLERLFFIFMLISNIFYNFEIVNQIR